RHRRDPRSRAGCGDSQRRAAEGGGPGRRSPARGRAGHLPVAAGRWRDDRDRGPGRRSRPGDDVERADRRGAGCRDRRAGREPGGQPVNALRLQAAFLQRDWRYETSYRGMLALQLLGIVGTLVIFYSIGKLVGGDAASLREYGGEYFPFALIGLVVSDFFNAGLRSFSSRLRLAQTTGTLEAMFTTAAPSRYILMCSGTWDYLIATARLVISALIGVFVLGVEFEVDLLAALIVGVLSLLNFTAVGLLAAALILVIKRGDAVAVLGNIAASIFAGALFPIALLPIWLRWVAYVLPLHYSLDGLRRALLTGAGVGDLGLNMAVLAASSAVLVPVSLFALD